MSLAEDYNYPCPYCASENSLLIEWAEQGKHKIINDCETCCRPILIRFETRGNRLLSFSAEQENA